MKVLVTGVAGFIGSHLAARLLEGGDDVVAIDNLSTTSEQLHKDRLSINEGNIEFYNVDLEDFEKVDQIYKKHSFDRVYHLAAKAGVRDSMEHPHKYELSNCAGTLSILEAAKKNAVFNIVMTSSSSVYGENDNTPFKEEDVHVNSPLSVYAYTKRANELLAYTYALNHDLNITLVRPFTVYGSHGRPDMAPWIFTSKIAKGEKIDVFNHGNQIRDFTHVSDIVEGIVRAAERANGYNIYNLGRGEPTKLMDFISYIEEALGVVAKKNFLPPQRGDVSKTHADISKAREELGYEPKVDIREGMKDFALWYCSYTKST